MLPEAAGELIRRLEGVRQDFGSPNTTKAKIVLTEGDRHSHQTITTVEIGQQEKYEWNEPRNTRLVRRTAKVTVQFLDPYVEVQEQPQYKKAHKTSREA